ncbi:ABC transporter ATP-binding protein [Clostridium ihumii]|uniref:ABC transporter ATP-binding protein n=1 Tax=Clostridium ihumii TaxID=1470356 RepID=UPI00058BCBED|nr:ABC transporter ATP-binding protein [Clostridium ihumii]
MKSQNAFKIMFKEVKRIGYKNPGITIMILVASFIEALLLLGNTMALKNFFEKITYAVKSNAGVSCTLTAFIILFIIVILSDFFNALNNFLADKQAMISRKIIMEEFYIKMKSMKLLYFENPKFLDTLDKAKAGIDGSINAVISLEFILGKHIIYFVIITIYLYKIHPLLSLTIFCTFIPTFFSYVLRNRIKSKLENSIALQRRKVSAYEDYIGHKNYFKETRHLGAVKFFKMRLENSLNELTKLSIKSFKEISIIKLIINFIYFLGFILIIGIIYYLTLIKSISVAETGAVLTTVITMYNQMDNLFNFQIAGVSESYNSLYNLNKILDYEEDNSGEQICEDEKNINISMKNVDFNYPNSEKKVLENISIDINSGEIIAVVGENGSGKTTLSKVITGLYEPTKGDIFYNGKSFRNIDMTSIYKKISIVFQKFNHYPITVKENVALGNIDNLDELKVCKELEKVNLNYIKEKLHDGINTLLSKEFGGTDLSIGQWQRIAIARANYKDASLIVFDEPTASLDPLQEMDIMKNFIETTKNKTRILVTHRIGAARLADRIITMKDGEIIEVGTHDELINMNGEYAYLYNSQKQWYNN